MHYMAPESHQIDSGKKSIFRNTKEMVVSMLAFIEILNLLRTPTPLQSLLLSIAPNFT